MVRQETVQKELNIARVNYDNAVKIQEIYKQQTDNLNALYEEQDKMLEAIFGTDYASEKENVLEGEVSRLVLIPLAWKSTSFLTKIKITLYS